MQGGLSGPQRPAQNLEGIRLDGKKKVLAGTHRYPGQRLPGKAGSELIDPGENRGSGRAAHEGLSCWCTGRHPSQGTPGQMGHGEVRGCPIPGPHGLEAGAPQEALRALSCLVQQRGQGGVGDMPYLHWLELSFLPLPNPSH